MTQPQDHELEQWLGASRTAEAARARRRSAAWQQHGTADASLVGVMLDLADLGVEVMVSLTNGHDHRGRILEVAPDWMIIAKRSGDLALCRSRCIASITCTERRRSFGSRTCSDTTGFAAVLERIGVERIVSLWCGMAALRGELELVGDELAVLTSGATIRHHVRLEAVDEATVSARP